MLMSTSPSLCLLCRGTRLHHCASWCHSKCSVPTLWVSLIPELLTDSGDLCDYHLRRYCLWDARVLCFQPEQQWSICMYWHGISPTVYSCDWGLNTWVGHMCMHVHEVGLLAVPHWTGCCTGYYSYTWPLHWVGCGSFNLSTLLVCDVVGYNEHIICSVQYRPRYNQPVVYQDKLLSKVWINYASVFYASLTCHCSMKCTTELFGFTIYPVHTTALFRFSY